MFPLADLTPIAAAIAGALFGGGGIVAWLKLGPERKATAVGYQLEIIEDLVKRNKELGKESRRNRRRIVSLEDRIVALELAQDDPPPYLG